MKDMSPLAGNSVREEEWRDIPGWEGMYQASSLGRIRSIDRHVISKDNRVVHHKERVLRQNRAIKNYLVVSLSRDNKWVSQKVNRLVAMSFLGTPQVGSHARHIDGNNQNNRVTNIEWGTVTDNNRDKRRHGKNRPGETNPSAKLKNCEAALIKRLIARGLSDAKIAHMFLVTYQLIGRIRKKIIWTWLEPL
jgi:hypothetical protein